MPYEELQDWLLYLEKRPLGWREDLRTFMLLRAQGLKDKPENVFASLRPIFAENNGEKSFSGSALFQKLLHARGGDRLEALTNGN